MAILGEIIINAFLCIVISKLPETSQCPPTTAEDLQDEYYTVIPAVTDQFLPQDEKDAQAIIDSNKNVTVIAGILSYREKVRRYAINMKMATNSTDKKTPWFPETYTVEQKPFDDFCFGLVQKEATVLGNYMKYFIEDRDCHRVGIAMVLTKDTHDMITTFDSHFDKKFDAFRMDLGEPYKILVKNWAQQNREPLEKDEPNQDCVTKDANALNTEHTAGWQGNRTQLECILFQKSIKYARAVILEFEKLNKGNIIEDIITGTENLDETLASTYCYFARYIKNKPKFIADILLQYSDGSDFWAMWIMCIAVVHPQEWSKVDDAFKKCHGGSPLKADHNFLIFKEMRKAQRHPFENMLRVWVRHNRDPIEAGEPNKEDVAKDAIALKDEHDSGDWHEKNRDQLELILMYKSIKYARAVITEFETIMGNKTIDSIINDCVKNETKLNHDLADAYSSLARYIKDKYSYIADILGKYSDDKDYWAAWIMCIAVIHPQEWSKVNLAFKKNNNDDSLSEFIMKNLTTDKIMAEMIAVIVDSDFKPTTFTEKPIQDDQEGCPVPSILPPVHSTLMVPAPTPKSPSPPT